MTGMIVVTVLMVVLEGALMAATPWLMPPTECFAVTVPPSAQREPQVRGFKRTFAGVVMGTTLASALVLGLMMSRLAGVTQPTDAQANLMTGVLVAATLIPIVVGTACMLYFRARVRELKQAHGWSASTARAAAVVAEDAPKPISLAWYLLYLPLVLGMVMFALRSYERFPDQIPMNADLAGNVSQYAAKSLGSVLFPALTTAFFGLVFALVHISMLVSKRPVDPAAPSTSSYAYGRFVRLQSQAMLVGGLVLSAGTGVCFYLTALGSLSLMAAATIMIVVSLVVVAGFMVVSLVTGQAGGRLAAELRPNDEVARDDDAYWPLGVFYFNADDPSVVVPKRFGVGWTINVARPAAWLAMAGLVVLTVAFALLVNWAVG